jgi:hypothetical protein
MTATYSSVGSVPKTARKQITFEDKNLMKFIINMYQNEFRRDAYEEETGVPTIVPRRLVW